MVESGGASLAMKLALILSLKVIRVAGIQLEVQLQVPLTPGRRRDIGDGIPNELQSTTSTSYVVQVGTLSNY